LVVDRQAGHVGREQVRRELDPAERATEALGDRLREDRLARARDVLDQDVAATHERDEGEAHLVVLANDHALDIGEDAIPGLLDVGHLSSPQRPSDGGWYAGPARMVPGTGVPPVVFPL